MSLTALPSEGYRGRAPKFPLPRRIVHLWAADGKSRSQLVDEVATDAVAARELELWRWAWRTPQAAAWSIQAWRAPIIAMWVRTFVICEASEATAADKGALHRFADQIGLTPAGLKENGWAIATDEVAARARTRPAKAAEAPAPRRLRSASSAATGNGE